MNDYWNDPPEDSEPPECCGDYMDVTEDGACVCHKCKKRIEPQQDPDMITLFDWQAERDSALAKLDVLERSIADMSHPNMRMLLADLEAERVARKALTKALMICIRYADSSADTEQAYAALALAAKLP